MRRLLRFSCFAIAAVMGPILVWEIWLQYELYFINKDPYETIMYRDLHHRINAYWNDGYENKKIFWGPPYNVFLNRGADDPARLELIHAKSVLPTSHNGMTPNFLRPISTPENSHYQVHINSLGFRGPERRIEVPPKTIRIVVLGSYPAFGSGVNDDETYSALLERRLTELRPDVKFEVWNGGQQGTTAISGYARLVREVIKYRPDLLIWDFGWVDLYFGKDFVAAPEDARYGYPFTQEAARILWRRFPSFLFSRHLYHFLNRDFRKVLLEDWRRVNLKMIEFAERQKLPVYLLKQRVVIIPTAEYEAIARAGTDVTVFDFQPLFRASNISLAKGSQDEFWSRPNWLSEGGYSRGDHIPIERMYRVDAIMYGKFAHKLIADKLAERLKGRIDELLAR